MKPTEPLPEKPDKFDNGDSYNMLPTFIFSRTKQFHLDNILARIWATRNWIDCFPVKWHIVKDLPNSLLKLIIIENNENKPVTGTPKR
ncbi:hypothetical protein L2E82_49045 [Cichorium intybus]|uniref:Uncharacterized protein n=1 Tax=Cichorium intybus TaxID=13427 RepID=A0ACB8Z0U3_CICIN|nr:hypothetical protein L2E82_49045 [Cichorium intybus]